MRLPLAKRLDPVTLALEILALEILALPIKPLPPTALLALPRPLARLLAPLQRRLGGNAFPERWPWGRRLLLELARRWLRPLARPSLALQSSQAAGAGGH